ncbi:MAG: phosphatase PAP2 family protein [Acidovorax sp.]|uniref:acid phosphatase n=1 Tax=Acidovorax sp. TaxID=1872122 RepID=UPI0039E22768
MRYTPTATALAAALLASACTTAPKPPTTLAEVGEVRAGTGYAKGYLARDDMADSLALVPPPPAEGSAELAADVAAYRALTALRSGPRGAQASKDAELRFPAAASHFSCALGVQISEQTTPHLTMLLRRTLVDAGGATYKAKDKYQRARPFMVFNEPTCTPGDEPALRKDGSYPSGHSAAGWAWALVLTQLAPERTDALLQRGRAYAQSRGVCGVHWKSDIEAGRLVGSGAVARLQSNPVFTAQMAEARQEIARARAAGQVPPAAACAAEAAALDLSTRLAP